MFERMLIPLDGSKVAESILPYAFGLARVIRCKVALASVVAPPPVEMEEASRRVGFRLEEVVESSRALTYLQALARRQATGVDWEGKTYSGEPAVEIIEAARRGEFDLIAMATHGRSGINRWMEGSVTDQVTRQSPVPVLVIRARPEGELPRHVVSFKQVVVPLDGSPLAEGVLPHAAELAKRMHVKLLLVRAVSDPTLPYMWGVETAYYVPELLQGIIDSAREYLGKISERLRSDGLEVEAKVMEGEASRAIIAASEPGSIVVMSSRGHGGMKRFILGSVADRMVRSSEVPVMIVSPEGQA